MLTNHAQKCQVADGTGEHDCSAGADPRSLCQSTTFGPL